MRSTHISSLPIWLKVLFATLAVARFLVWTATDAEHRRVYRRLGLVVFWLVWVPFWVWVLAEVASVGELIRDKQARIILAVMSVLALIEYCVTPRIEDWLRSHLNACQHWLGDRLRGIKDRHATGSSPESSDAPEKPDETATD
jgi:hypothetical protein